MPNPLENKSKLKNFGDSLETRSGPLCHDAKTEKNFSSLYRRTTKGNKGAPLFSQIFMQRNQANYVGRQLGEKRNVWQKR